MRVFMMCGLPGSGKSTFVRKEAIMDGETTVISADTDGTKWIRKYGEELNRKTKRIVLDNNHLTRASRAPLLELANRYGYKVVCFAFIPPKNRKSEYMVEDNSIRLLQRCYELTGSVSRTGKEVKCPGVFPISVLFSARKSFEEPTIEEGFYRIEVITNPPIQWPDTFRNRAILFDIDGTLRRTEHLPNKYPTVPEEVLEYTDRDRMLNRIQKYREDGYKFCGVSNQSGISKGVLTTSDCSDCMIRTKELLDFPDLDIEWCPHSPAPITCYCRKPQSGLGVHFIYKYELDPKECIVVGDRTTDRTFAERLGMRFILADEFWRE